jgi:hypothetical protein
LNPAASWPFTYRFLGYRPGLAKEFSALLSGCGFVPASGENARVTIMFLPPEELAALPDRESMIEWRDLTIGTDAAQVLFKYQSWQLGLDLATLTFRCSGPDPDPAERLNFREFFLLSPILFLMHRLGYFELHAAACARDESGYVLLGPSGSGKTTAMLSLIASGWNYLSDDAIVVSNEPEGRILARPLRRSFSLKPDHLHREPELAVFANESVPRTNKRRFDPRQIWPEQYSPVTEPKFIVSCSVIDDETSRLTPISRAEALGRLVGSTPWLMFDQATAAAHLEMFRSLAETCSAFELRAGRDLIRNRRRVAALIAPEALVEAAGKGER